MERFNEEFVPMDGPMLRQIISDTDRDGGWPIRFSKTNVPYFILDSRTYEGETTKKKYTFGLKDLNPAPHFDLVIIDEVQHIRNGSMEKVFEYKYVKYFCDNADAVVMLIATPLQTSDDDLFTMPNALRQDVVIDKQTFNMMSHPNSHFSEAASMMRRADEKWQELASEALKGVLDTQRAIISLLRIRHMERWLRHCSRIRGGADVFLDSLDNRFKRTPVLHRTQMP